MLKMQEETRVMAETTQNGGARPDGVSRGKRASHVYFCWRVAAYMPWRYGASDAGEQASVLPKMYARVPRWLLVDEGCACFDLFFPAARACLEHAAIASPWQCMAAKQSYAKRDGSVGLI